jgi:hypothetical protein|uniref:Uncharacterized protein n=1 Tax=viral metagenome TaxID=1070528 RepID=A0A6C0E961_9ZZZZ
MKKLYLLFIVFVVIFLLGSFYRSLYNKKEKFDTTLFGIENKESKTIFQFLNPVDVKDIKGIDPNDYTIMGKQKTKCNEDGVCIIDARF